MHSLVRTMLGTCERIANKFLHRGANYTYMYNLHTVCKSAHVNGALGIEFYLFVFHGGMNDRGSTCKFRNERSAFQNLQVDPLSFIPP